MLMLSARICVCIGVLLSFVILQVDACMLLPIAFSMFEAGRRAGEKGDNARPQNKFLGCFADSEHNRAMGKRRDRNAKMKQIHCMSKCKDSKTKFMGVENGTDCYCADSYNRFGEVPNSKCDMPCGGDPHKACGGKYALSVYPIYV